MVFMESSRLSKYTWKEAGERTSEKFLYFSPISSNPCGIPNLIALFHRLEMIDEIQDTYDQAE
jgi:hypothetical protein